MAGHSLKPAEGFNWTAVSWGGPDERVAEACSYCDAPLHDEEIPLILYNDLGWAARFCEACCRKWWGFR
jgi:hypothetical protein